MHYDLRDSLAEIGQILPVNQSPGATETWNIVKRGEETFVFQNGDETVTIKQSLPSGEDFAFRATAISPSGEEQQLFEHKQIRPVWIAAQSYMKGYENGCKDQTTKQTPTP